jgi:hypothetical protein
MICGNISSIRFVQVISGDYKQQHGGRYGFSFDYNYSNLHKKYCLKVNINVAKIKFEVIPDKFMAGRICRPT